MKLTQRDESSTPTGPEEPSGRSHVKSDLVTEEQILAWLELDEPTAEQASSERAAGRTRNSNSVSWRTVNSTYRRSHRYLSVKKIYDVSIVRLNTTRLDAQNFERVLGELFFLVNHDGHSRILLNLAGVEYIYTAALITLVTFARQLEDNGGEICLCNIHPVLRELFDAIHITDIFEIRNSQREALNVFS